MPLFTQDPDYSQRSAELRLRAAQFHIGDDARQLTFPWHVPVVVTRWEDVLPATIGLTKAQRKPQDRGWRTSTGYIYLRCPFHAEKTPSLRLNKFPDPIWYCFGCCRLGMVDELINQLKTNKP